ncbi:MULTISPECIES: LysR family transcriptional regulator [unclassified Neptuniibacter]|uniref:LysR family transcriptional regulator n=1 Tax=unclassified Neptuniibacter TaxID=2630693 RepID=UPI000C3A27CC|nr:MULTISPECIES: LysR family transcriptional regulator [unclassified Neptuniibacter]MAY42450.1 LysR family transcriptional regulator [Oceanospirillaceae bacterium]|tara:strand:+ start:35783 stop:36724 length:942 start_codon:yes stop_codon:yes gene_type:complete
MNLDKIDLNLLVYLDVLLRERNVTRSASLLGITQPAMSNGLRRLRETFGDPLLLRTSEGMMPTERAQSIQPLLRQVLASVEQVIEPITEFDARSSDRVFRIMTSDYGEATLLPRLLNRLRKEAPDVVLDILTPSDMSFQEVEQGLVDLVINRFDTLPQSFHQKTLWKDSFSCLFAVDNALADDFRLETYLHARHVWVSKTGMGAGMGITPKDTKRLGWVDEALEAIGAKRHISVFTRHYQSAALLAEQKALVATIPTKAAVAQYNNPRVIVKKPPFDVPEFELKMAWSPLLQHNAAHRWIRGVISEVAQGTLE